MDTNFIQWTDNTNCWLSVPVVQRFTGVPSGLRQSKPPHISKDPSTLSILTERVGRQAPSMSQLKRLDTRHNSHSVRELGAMCVPPKTKKLTKFKGWECNIGLCAAWYFKVYHTTLHFWGSADTEMEDQNTQMSANITTHTNVSKYYHSNAEVIFFSNVF
jgi:hypothetical protein